MAAKRTRVNPSFDKDEMKKLVKWATKEGLTLTAFCKSATIKKIEYLEAQSKLNTIAL